MANYPSGTCNCIGLWLDRPQHPSALAVVHAALLAISGVRDQDEPTAAHALMLHKNLGPLGVRYESGGQIRIDYQNPYDGPVEVLSGKERGRLKALEAAGGKLMRALCDALDPAYAIHGGDATIIPVPKELELGTDFYVSRRFAAEVTLPGGKTEDWAHGTHGFTVLPYERRESYEKAAAELSRSVARALTRPRRL